MFCRNLSIFIPDIPVKFQLYNFRDKIQKTIESDNNETRENMKYMSEVTIVKSVSRASFHAVLHRTKGVLTLYYSFNR